MLSAGNGGLIHFAAAALHFTVERDPLAGADLEEGSHSHRFGRHLSTAEEPDAARGQMERRPDGPSRGAADAPGFEGQG
jgi:hypothetical protein